MSDHPVTVRDARLRELWAEATEQTTDSDEAALRFARMVLAEQLDAFEAEYLASDLSNPERDPFAWRGTREDLTEQLNRARATQASYGRRLHRQYRSPWHEVHVR